MEDGVVLTRSFVRFHFLIMTDRHYVEIDLRVNNDVLIMTNRHYKEIDLRNLLSLFFRVRLRISTFTAI